MPYKNGLEPKDARTFDTYDNNNDFDFDDDDDLDDWTTKPRPRRTGTQALVDFLNTTSPEEFQKTAPAKKSPYKILTTNSAKRITSTSFFLRRRNKSKSSSSSTSASIPSSTSSTHSDTSSMTSFYQKLAPNTIHRKNHIEILAHNSGTGASATKLSLNEPARYRSSLHGASARHTPAKSPYLNHTTGIPGPTDAFNNGDPIFGDTLPITLPIPSATALSPRSAKPQTSNASKNDTPHHEHGSHNESETNQTNTTATIGVDEIEAGLIQRLKQWQLAEPDKSMYKVDQYANAPTSDPPSHPTGRQSDRFTTKRARHAQIQTLPWNTPPPSTTDLTPPSKSDPPTISIDPAIDDLRRQISQERQKRHHLETAIQQTCAHFDILSDLAYKKLTELWDEKVRWENACLELNEDLLKAEQDTNPTTGPLTDDFQTTALA